MAAEGLVSAAEEPPPELLSDWICLNPLCPRNIGKDGKPIPYWDRAPNTNGKEKEPACEDCDEEMTLAQKNTRGRKLADFVRELSREDNKQLLLAVQRADLVGATRLIEEKGADVDVSLAWEDGCTPLHHAARLVDLALATMLLDHGANPNIHDHQMGFTPIFYAVRAGRYSATVKEAAAALALAQLLLARGANLEGIVDKDGNNVTFWAQQLGNDAFLQLPNLPEAITRSAAERNALKQEILKKLEDAPPPPKKGGGKKKK